jgi:hypothetical protein
MTKTKTTTPSFDVAEMVSFIETMAGFGARRAGTDANHRTEDFLVERLTSFGCENVRREAIAVEKWTVERSSFEVGPAAGGALSPMAAQWLPYCAFTPEGGIEAELVYADPARLRQGGDWRGKIVVTDIEFPALDVAMLGKLSFGRYDPDNTLERIKHPATWVRKNWHFYREAINRGAVGFVGILKDQPGGSHRMYAPYGFREANILDKPLPGFWVGRDDGPRLRELARSGGRARLTLTGERGPGLTHNIVAEIPGTGTGGTGAGGDDEVVILHSHHDSPFKSPVEDASGCAVVLALAKHFSALQTGGVKRRIVVLFTAGHFYGSIGTRTFIGQHAHDIVPRVALEISIEHIAKEAEESPDGKSLVATGRPEGMGVFVPFNAAMVGAVLKNLEAHHVDRSFLLPCEGPLGDFPPTDGGDWYEAGVPVVNLISNPVYLLNEEDDFEWVDQDRLVPVAEAVAGLVRDVDGLTKAQIGRVEFKARKLQMQFLKHVVRAKTTWFGTRPVY